MFKLFWAFPAFFFYILLASNNHGVVQAAHKVYIHYQTAPALNVHELHRTGYHFQPKKHWMNDANHLKFCLPMWWDSIMHEIWRADPNAPMYFNGYYHLFYQYNPKGSVWGNTVWAHSVSKDLINWIPLEPAIVPSKHFDKYGCWSGSATILPGNKPVLFYTGVVDGNETQVQNYALPANISDPYLRKWVKPDDNPLIVAEKGVSKTAFRDPSTAWLGQDKQWRITIGGSHRHTGVSFLYISKDLKKWRKAEKPLHSVPGTGIWECPDFFPVSNKGQNGLDTSEFNQNVKYVLKVSLDALRYDYYTIGTYDSKKNTYAPDKASPDNQKGLRLDYGQFYASKSFYDLSKQRRIYWAWSNESNTAQDDIKKGWAGIQLIPRRVWLHPQGKQLLQWPIEELETLRANKVHIVNRVLKKGDKIEVKGITAAQADVEVTFSFPSLEKAEPFDPSWIKHKAQDICSVRGSFVQGGLGPFGLATLASTNLEEYTPVFFRVFKAAQKHKVLMCSDATKSSLKHNLYKPSFAGFVDVELKDKQISLRSLIDNSVVESFGAGGKTCISSRVYPTLAVYNKSHLYAFNNGTETITVKTLEAWSMKNPKQMN